MGFHFNGRASGGVNVTLLVLVAILVLIGVAGFFGWDAWQRLGERLEAMESELAEVQSSREQDVAAVASGLAQVERKVSDLAARSERRANAMAELQQSGQRDWLLNEAETLARLAEERLLLTADLAATERLLEVADRTLARLDDPEVLPARRALAKDIEAVRGARHVDVQALMLKLAALQDVVPEVAVAPSARDVTRSDVEAGQNADNSWQALLASLPIRIQRQNGDHPLPLNAQQASLLRLSLDSSLQQARMALQQGQPSAWTQAIDHAQSVVREWLPTGQPRVKQMLAALSQLEAAAVDQALPDIGGGRTAIRTLRENGAGADRADSGAASEPAAAGTPGVRPGSATPASDAGEGQP